MLNTTNKKENIALNPLVDMVREQRYDVSVQIFTVSRYREILNDYKTDDEYIKAKIKYIENFCREIIKMEIKKYVEGRN